MLKYSPLKFNNKNTQKIKLIIFTIITGRVNCSMFMEKYFNEILLNKSLMDINYFII